MRKMRQALLVSMIMLLNPASPVWAAPRISSVSPTSGPPGSCLVINGSEFGATQGTKTVAMAGMGRSVDSLRVRSWSDTKIEAEIPSNIEAGRYELLLLEHRPRRTFASNLVPLTIVMPRITDISPGTAAEGDTLWVKGANFGDRLCSKTHVAIGGHGAHVDATLVSWSNIGITVRIPKSDKLKPGNRYYLGISAERDARWLSNIDQTFRFQERR
ncbi:MAG: IPT/TIG domain-containing protein [candidate division NC10 bacterium]|nr:IPT/TIG domain-containing protein [candidate division NC10 bacterium]